MKGSMTLPLEWPWAQRKRYMKPCLAMAGTTVYNTSFLNTCDDSRRCPYKHPDHGDIIGQGHSNDGLSCYGASYEPTEGHVNVRPPDPSKPEDNLRTGIGDVANDTINKMSYPGWPGFAPPMTIMPPRSVLAMKGPMSRMTTTRHDYTAKGVPRPDIIVPEEQIKISNRPMEGNTTAQLSFQEPDYSSFVTQKSYKPKAQYDPPKGAVTGNTVCNMSYKPIPIPPKEEYPWMAKKTYEPPTTIMDGTSVYNTSFLNNCDDSRRCPYKHPDHGDIIGQGHSNDGLSCYGASYEPTEGHVNVRPPDPSKPEDNLRTGIGDVAKDTINRMSFKPTPGMIPPEPIIPGPSTLAHRGPMSKMTTTRHDYTSKNAAKPDIIVPEGEIKVSLKPMEGQTTAGMSFQEPDMSRFQRAQSFKEQRQYDRSRAPFQGQSVARMSYTGEQPKEPPIIAARGRAPLPPLSEAERHMVCSPVASPPASPKPASPGSLQPWRPERVECPPEAQRQFVICRPQQGASVSGVPTAKDLYTK